MKVRAAAAVLLFACLAPLTAVAQNAQEFGRYVVHYNAFTADILQPEMARKYDIRRSPSRAVLNVVVMRKEGEETVPVKAEIDASGVNLNRQLRRFRMREVTEGDAIYYLADFQVANKEMLDFTLTVTPQDSSRELQVEFRQQFFTEPPP